MSALDEILSCAIFYILLPSLLIFLIAYYILGLRKEKIEAFVCNLLCGWTHGLFCNKQKALLFEHMTDLKKNTGDSLNILEIGVGSGMNFKFYPLGSRVTGLDPNPHHEYYVNKNVLNSDNHVNFLGFIQGYGENMVTIKDNTYDAVVCTLTLCTVQDPDAVLKEVKRVLKPGGTFYYLEHVAAEKGSFHRKVQDILQCIWPYFSSGCCINRETWNNLDNSTFSQIQYRHYSPSIFFGLLDVPAMYGTAVK